MRIISYNVNGIRAAIKKGFLDWLKTNPADIICVQETKALKEDVDHKPFNELGYYDYWFSAQKKGYSGVAVFTKIKPDNVEYGNGHGPSDDEGRVIQLDFGELRLINAYFPVVPVAMSARILNTNGWMSFINGLINSKRKSPTSFC